MTEAFPLHWPDGWPRTAPHHRAWSLPGGRGHTQSFSDTLRRLLTELDRLGAGPVVVSTNQPLRQDGLPYANRAKMDDPGAAVYFELGGKHLVMAQDRYELLADNLRSLALAIEGLRQMDRHGGGHMMERAFQGFQALPAPDDWRRVLGLDREKRTLTLVDVNEAFRAKARDCHPDQGGSTDAMARLNAARDAAIIEIRGH